MQVDIYLAKSGEIRDEALDFIAAQMIRAHGAHSRVVDVPEHLFVAKNKGMIVATLAMELKDDNNRFSLHRWYSSTGIEHLSKENKTFFFVRWLSTVSGIGLLLVSVVAKFALNNGFESALCIMKEDIFQYLDVYSPGAWQIVPDTHLITSAIPKEYEAYFLSHTIPSVYVVDIKKHTRSVQKELSQFSIVEHF